MCLNLLTKSKLPIKTPIILESTIAILKHTKSKELCLKKAYSILTAKYRGYRFQTYLKLPDLFETNLNAIWKKSGFLHCTQLNYLLRFLLVKSGHFKNSDIQHNWTLIWYISPHQYNIVKLSNQKFITIDIWGKNNEIEYGAYAHGFN